MANFYVNAWDISTIRYDDKYKSLISQDEDPTGLFFKSDGTKMYVVGENNKKVYQYSLSTAWDVSTASYESKYKDVSAQDTAPRGLYFNSDGTKMYVVGNENSKVFQYTLSTPWDISTASYDSKYKDVYSQLGISYGLFFKSDGTKMYVVGENNKKVYQYSLSTAWDVSTASYESKYKDVSAQDTAPRGIYFKSDGTKMFIVGYANKKVYQYSLSSVWDISTATYDSKYFDVSSQYVSPMGLFFNPDGVKTYVTGRVESGVWQYSLSGLIDSVQLNDLIFKIIPIHFSETITLNDQINRKTPFGIENKDTLWIYDGFIWHEFPNFDYFKWNKTQNGVSEFELDISDISTEQKAYFKERAEILFFCGTAMKLKGRIEKITYKDGYIVQATGYGMEIRLKDQQYISNGDNRIQFDNTPAKEVIEDINADILTPSNSGIFATDYGNISMRFEYANRLDALASTVDAIDYYWWVSQDSNSSYVLNYLNVSPTQGSNTSVKTFNLGNCEFEQERDTANLVNYVHGLGYGDGVNQLSTYVYAASTQSSFLSANIEATDTTIPCLSVTAFNPTGSIRIAKEVIQYAGKDTANGTLTGCTRGSDAKAHYKNCYVEQHYETNSAQSASSIGLYGVKEYSYIDKSIINEETLEVVISKYLYDRKNVVQSIKVKSDEVLSDASLNIGDLVTVTSSESNLNGDYRIVEQEFIDNYGDLSLTTKLSNTPASLISAIKTQQSEAENSAKYMQGATNIYAINEAENCDENSPLNLRFFVPNEAIAINKVLLNFKMKNYRSYTKVTENNSERTIINEAGEIHGSKNLTTNSYTTVASFTTGETDCDGINIYGEIDVVDTDGESPSGSSGYFTYRIYDGTNYYPNSGGATICGGHLNHTEPDSLSGTISQFIPGNQKNKTFYFQIRWYGYPNDTDWIINYDFYYLTTSPHTHNQKYEIDEEILTNPLIEVYVGEDGGTMNYKDTYSTDQTEIDITDEVTSIGKGKWVNIKFVPNKRMRIEANSYVQIFIESK